MRCCFPTVIALLIGGWSAVADGNASGSKEYVFDEGCLRIVFAESGGKAILTSLSGSDGTEWLARPGESHDLWRLALKGPKGEPFELKSSEARFLTGAAEASSVQLRWQGQEPASPIVDLRVFAGEDHLSHWLLSIEAPDGWSLARCDFPIIPNVALRDGLKLATPFGWGLEYDVKPGMGYAGTYSSCQAGMQFVALYGPPRPRPLS